MKKIVFFCIILLLAIFSSCQKANNDSKNGNLINDSIKNINISNKTNQIKLIFPYSKLEFFFGKNFIPVFNKVINADSDLNEEYIIAYKKDEESNVTVVLFDIAKGDILKIKFIYDSNIFYSSNFSLHAGNLFYEKDMCLVIEGKSKDNKNILVIIKYENENYNIVQEFTGDYSVTINYKEIETDKSKYFIINNIVTINSSFSSTNTNIQKKEIYEWDYNSSTFKIVQTEEFTINNNILNSTIYYSEEKYFNYILGFWYPLDYQTMIEKNKISEDLLNEENIQFLFFSDNPLEVNIKHGDYIDKYSIFKISRIWDQQRPGLRLFLTEFSKPNNNYIKFMDVYLMNDKSLKVSGPETFFIADFVRLAKPFLEYVNEKKEEINKKRSVEIFDFLQGEFVGNGYILNIKEYSYKLQKDGHITEGYYKILFNKNYSIISFVEDNSLKENIKLKDHPLINQNYVINILKEENYFVLLPVKLNLNDFSISEISSIIFKKYLK
ncbi:MAG TPA: hypothetical protein PLE45_07920 [Spirochaetota bacterium]|nr:hypothetical protein [Spirochaetota bacterium]